MAFLIFSDSGCNLPMQYLQELSIEILSFPYRIDGVEQESPKAPELFDAHDYYQKLQNGMQVETSLISVGTFEAAFCRALEQGYDALYIGLSSGVSGTFQASCVAARSAMDRFPERTVLTFDTMGASLGIGLMVCRAAACRDRGLSIQETYDALMADRPHLCQYFTVGDLMFLRRTGRVSTTSAVVGSMLQIKPLLYGDENGKIVVYGKVRGRKKAIDALVERYSQRVLDPAGAMVFISHGDCPEEAEALARQLAAAAKPQKIVIAPHEPFTGSHVGPGMLAVYFLGESR